MKSLILFSRKNKKNISLPSVELAHRMVGGKVLFSQKLYTVFDLITAPCAKVFQNY